MTNEKTLAGNQRQQPSLKAQAGRVIAVEGLDGAGKSTVIAVLAKRLREAGCPVFLPRTGKDPTSRPARMIRNLTRERLNLDLIPRAELALYAAREAQILSEQVRPAVASGHAVLLDRSMLTPVVLGSYGRGIPLADCEAIAQAASAGLNPDVTIILDVHPRTSRLRKRLGRARNPTVRNPSRKGLSGSGLKERQWAGYREVAAERGYLLFHTERIDPSELADRVTQALATGSPPSDFEQPGDGTPRWMVDPGLSFEAALEQVPEDLALYMTRGLIAGRERRRAAVEREPRLVAWALDPEDPLGPGLAETDAKRVFSGWIRKPLSGPDDLRVRLATKEPAAVASSLRHNLSPEADALRTQLAEAAPGEVIESLAGREDAFATQLRARLWSQATVTQAANSLVRCEGKEAWTQRNELFERDPAMALKSVRGLSDAETHRLLARYSTQAPKSVLRALTSNGTDFAHDLRRQLVNTGREVIDSVGLLADEASMKLREEHVETWPSSVLGSMTHLSTEPGVAELLARATDAGAGDLHVLRQLQARKERELRPEWKRTRDSDEDVED
ncbi:MAG: dTMP kinase [Myxococcota bacterium]